MRNKRKKRKFHLLGKNSPKNEEDIERDDDTSFGNTVLAHQAAARLGPVD